MTKATKAPKNSPDLPIPSAAETDAALRKVLPPRVTNLDIWELGRILHRHVGDKDSNPLAKLAEKAGCTKRLLEECRLLYRCWPDDDPTFLKSLPDSIMWTTVRASLRLDDQQAREEFLREAVRSEAKRSAIKKKDDAEKKARREKADQAKEAAQTEKKNRSQKPAAVKKPSPISRARRG